MEVGVLMGLFRCGGGDLDKGQARFCISVQRILELNSVKKFHNLR